MPHATNIPMVVAHRAGALHAPENTLAAIRAALADSVAAIEVDVRLTQDGIPVLLHDRELDRTTNGKGPVSQMTLNALRNLDAGSWFADRFHGECVPTLDEALALVDGRAELLVEIKGGEQAHPGITDAVLDDIERHEAAEWIYVMSFHNTPLEITHRRLPNVRITKLMLGRIPGTPIFFDHRLRSRLPLPTAPIHAVAINRRLISADQVKKLRERGIEVFVWTPNTAEEITQALGSSPDAIITDAPRLARQILQSHHHAPPAH